MNCDNMDTVKCCLLCLIVLSTAIATSALRHAFCPHRKDGVLSARMQSISWYLTIPIIGQSQEVRCYVPDNALGKSKLVWFKDNNQVSITNTSDGRVTVAEGVVQVPENISHSCLSRNTTFYASVLSIRNFDKADYGRYDCHVVPNPDSASMMEKGTTDFVACTDNLQGPDTGPALPVRRRLTKSCKTHLTCKVFCYGCCTCDTCSCRMLLLKDGKMVTSTASVKSESDSHIFTSTLKISIDSPEDFGRYDCVLRQLVVDCVDGSMFENSWVGLSLDILHPEELVSIPWKVLDRSETHLHCLFSEPYQRYLTITGPTWKTWEVVLRKDGKEVASKESLLSPDNTVRESFSLKKSQDVFGRYECVIREAHHGCIKQAWFKDRLTHTSHLSLVLHPRSIYARMSSTIEQTCAFLVQRRGADRFAVVVTFNGNEVFRHDKIKITPSDDKTGDIVSANFDIELKDPTSFGVYSCTLQKNGLPDPSAQDVDDTSGYDWGHSFPNTFQITPITIRLPAHPTQIPMKLGSSIYLPCHSYDDAITSIDKVPQLSWYRNGVQVRDDDRHTTFVSQTFWDSRKLVHFLWCNLTVEHAEALGTYECRYKDDKDVAVTIQSFFIEPENWTEQAHDLFNSVKACAEGIRMRDRLLSEFSIVVGVLGVIVTCMSLYFVDRLSSWIKQKRSERDIRVTLDNIQQMEALNGCGEDSHRYDVFISYSSADASWVRGDLLDNLESNGYTVCLDTRDFGLGKPVLTNIATAIYQSRKVILVMSKNFIKSGWCMHELVLTYQRKLDQKENCVVVMKYDDCKIPKETALRTYLDWTEPMARETFWAKLHEWLGPPSPPLLCIEDKKEAEVEELFGCQDSETCQHDEGNPADTNNESDDFVLVHRKNISNTGCD